MDVTVARAELRQLEHFKKKTKISDNEDEEPPSADAFLISEESEMHGSSKKKHIPGEISSVAAIYHHRNVLTLIFRKQTAPCGAQGGESTGGLKAWGSMHQLLHSHLAAC